MPALFLAVLLAQAPPVESGDAAQLDRIRRALADPPAIRLPSVTRTEGPVFRVFVNGRRPDKPVWEDWSSIPSSVRPRFPSYHYQFLQQVTPEEFRASTLYPQGIPVDRVVALLARQIRAAIRKRQEGNAKEEVRKALEALLACRANPDRPGC
jgi:hypothetical protein